MRSSVFTLLAPRPIRRISVFRPRWMEILMSDSVSPVSVGRPRAHCFSHRASPAGSRCAAFSGKLVQQCVATSRLRIAGFEFGSTRRRSSMPSSGAVSAMLGAAQEVDQTIARDGVDPRCQRIVRIVAVAACVQRHQRLLHQILRVLGAGRAGGCGKTRATIPPLPSGTHGARPHRRRGPCRKQALEDGLRRPFSP